MFGKFKKAKRHPPLTVAKKQETTPLQAATTVGEKTIIAENISIEGQIRGAEHLVVDGALKGNVELKKHDVTVGLRGRVDSQIRAQNVSIRGRFMGTIKALDKVTVTKDADFLGEIKAKSFAVEDGAYFKGSIELDRQPHRKPDFAPAPKQPAPADAARSAYSPSSGTLKES